MIGDIENIYNIGYLVLTSFAFKFPFVYAILLLDIVK